MTCQDMLDMGKTYHDDVISKPCLDLDELGAVGRACFKGESHLLKLGIQATLGLPT